MKLLNLDDIAPISRVVKLSGEEYPIAEQTVGGLIESIRVAKEAEKSEANDEVIFESMVRTARSILPTCPEHILTSMNLRQLTSLIEFASASDEQVVEGSEAGEDEAQDEGKPE